MGHQLPCAREHWHRGRENRDHPRRLPGEWEPVFLAPLPLAVREADLGDLVPCDDGRVWLRCVIVDDDEAFIKAAQAVLERDGVTVAGAAGSCAEAVRCAEALRPDVVLIDIRLGEESGFDVARRLADSAQAVSMIMISTHAGPDYADLIAESSAVGFVPKAQLSGAAIRRILGTS